MHPEAYAGATEMVSLSELDTSKTHKALDLGGVDINGTARALLPNAQWTGVDLVDGPGVDIVTDATTWRSKERYDVVFSTETLEHCQEWEKLLDTVVHHLDKTGPQVLVLTCASTGRKPHGADGRAKPGPDEWYENVDPGALEDALKKRFKEVHVRYQKNPGDAYAWARGVKQAQKPRVAPEAPVKDNSAEVDDN